MKTRMPKGANKPVGNESLSVHQVKIPLWPYLVTPASSVLLWGTTAGAYAMWHDAPGWPAAGITLAGVGLSVLTWRAAAARGIVRQALSTITCVGASVWTLGATLSAPWSRPWLDMWLIGAPAASIAMAVARILRAGRDDELDRDTGARLADAVQSLKRARIRSPRIDGAKITAHVELDHGTTAADLARDRGALASALDVPESAVRVIPNPDSARRGRIEVVPVDQLRSMIPWPGLSAPGGSIAEPIVLGVMEDGAPLQMWLPGDHNAQRPAAHYLVVGMSGAGKTEVILTICAEVMSRRDAELWLADPRKGDQLPDWARAGAARLATTASATEDMLNDLHRDVATRAHQIGAHGHKQWTTGCSHCPPYRVVIVDEAAEVTAGNSLVTTLTEEARSAGISLLVGLQRASHDRFPTSARANISGVVCLGVDSETDADMVLSEATLAAGAMPWTWKNTRPGYLYAEIPGTDPQRWTMPCRAFAADEESRSRAVAPYLRSTPASADQPTHEPTRTPDPRVRPDSADTDDAAVDPTDPPEDVDPAKPIKVPAGMPRIALGSRAPQMPAAEARQTLVQYIYDLADAGVTHLRPSDLGEVLAVTGFSGDWVRKQLGHLSQGPDAILRKTDRGVWEIRVPEPAQ